MGLFLIAFPAAPIVDNRARVSLEKWNHFFMSYVMFFWVDNSLSVNVYPCTPREEISLSTCVNQVIVCLLFISRRRGGGVLREKLSGEVCGLSRKPYPVSDQNLLFFSDLTDTLFQTYTCMYTVGINRVWEGFLLMVVSMFKEVIFKKNVPNSRRVNKPNPKWPKSISHFRPKQLKGQTLLGPHYVAYIREYPPGV